MRWHAGCGGSPVQWAEKQVSLRDYHSSDQPFAMASVFELKCQASGNDPVWLVRSFVSSVRLLFGINKVSDRKQDRRLGEMGSMSECSRAMWSCTTVAEPVSAAAASVEP